MLAAEHRQRLRLVVCNAVPDDAPIAVRQNGGMRMLSGLNYETCAEARGTIAEHDELEFLSPTAGAWTFQVGPLPAGAGRLLLVFEQARHHPGFRAVAFPEGAEDTATVAVLDTRHGAHDRRSNAALRVAAQKEADDSVETPTAELPFDHVYTLDAGEFDVSLAAAEAEAEAEMASLAAKLHAEPKQAYVVMRTGRPDQGFPESLVVFSAGSSFAAVVSLLLPLLALA